MCKYADETYLIIPSANEANRTAELVNVESWSQKNNLVNNRSKSLEIIFADRRRKRSFQQPSTIPYPISTECHLSIFLISWSCHIQPVCGHVNNIITSSAQSVHALRVLRSHGMLAECIHTIYRAVVIAKLTYVSSAWCGFTTAADRQRLEAVIRRGVRSGLCDPNQLTLNELIADIDDKLFFQAMYNNCHVLSSLLPNEPHRTYNLRQRRHNMTLLAKQYTVTESDFIVRMLYKDVY